MIKHLYEPAERAWTHLTVQQGVVVPPHFWVNIIEVPLKAPTLQTLPQCNPLGYVSIINTVVLQERQRSIWEVFTSVRRACGDPTSIGMFQAR